MLPDKLKMHSDSVNALLEHIAKKDGEKLKPKVASVEVTQVGKPSPDEAMKMAEAAGVGPETPDVDPSGEGGISNDELLELLEARLKGIIS